MKKEIYKPYGDGDFTNKICNQCSAVNLIPYPNLRWLCGKCHTISTPLSKTKMVMLERGFQCGSCGTITHVVLNDNTLNDNIPTFCCSGLECETKFSACDTYDPYYEEGEDKELPMTEKLQFKSQKIRGLYTLSTRYDNTLNIIKCFSSLEEIETFNFEGSVNYYPDGMFARPCPIRPRHGFVESRVVKNLEELKSLMEEVKKADPEGELMLTPMMKAEYNYIWTPSMLTIGLGHDGATAGKDTVNIPLCGSIPKELEEMLSGADIANGEWPYIEAVEAVESGADNVTLTQLRAGPPLAKARLDFIPDTITVKNIIKVDPKMSLLDWEEKCKSIKDLGVEGVVISHLGGSPVDHFSVHARSFGIPIVTSRKIRKGQVLKSKPFAPMTPNSVLRGLVLGDEFRLSKTELGNAVAAVLVGLHNSSYFESDDGVWLGVAAALMVRLGGTALRGEIRHLKVGKSGGSHERNKVYNRATKFSIKRHRAGIARLIYGFKYGKFASSSIGGENWAKCGMAINNLISAIGNLARSPSDEAVGELTRALNVAVNQAHNGGWWLNKFTCRSIFEMIPRNDPNSVINAGSTLYSVANQSISNAEVGRKIGVWAGWQPVDLTLLRPKSIVADLDPVSGALILYVKDRILSRIGDHKNIIVKPSILRKALPQLLAGRLIFKPVDTGFQIELRRPHEEPIVIFEEEPISLDVRRDI